MRISRPSYRVHRHPDGVDLWEAILAQAGGTGNVVVRGCRQAEDVADRVVPSDSAGWEEGIGEVWRWLFVVIRGCKARSRRADVLPEPASNRWSRVNALLVGV